jgi:hypothetical protein
MAYDPHGRTVRTLEEAEAFIRSFIAETKRHPSEHFDFREMDYDLFVPRLVEIAENLDLLPGTEPTPFRELEPLYMEAAWSLVMQGYLRPGPHGPNQSNTGDVYGKAYSLTTKGKEWLAGA